MQFSISITYETWDESAYEAGDTDDRGWEFQDQKIGYQDLIRLIRNDGFYIPSSSRISGYTWLSTDGREDLLTGEDVFRSLHISRANGARLSRRTMNKILRSAGIRT